MITLFLAAHAQSVPNGDFESGDTFGWTDRSTVTDGVVGLPVQTHPFAMQMTVQATPARGSWSALLTPSTALVTGPLGKPRLRVDVRSEPFVVTRTAVAFAIAANTLAFLNVTGQLLEAGTDTVVGPPSVVIPGSPDTFVDRQIDTTALCGSEVQLQWTGEQSVTGTPRSSLDGAVLTGAVCPQFLDGDGDGWCPRGTDLDLDGDCDDADELSVDAPIDCDDGDFAVGACLAVDAHPPWLQLGEPYVVTVSGALPGETVRLAASPFRGRTCLPPRLGALCLDVGSPPRVVDTAVADSSGVVVFTIVASEAQLAPYSVAVLQAVALRPGGSIATGPIDAPVRPAAGPPADPGIRNGGFDDGLVGWSEVAAVFGDANPAAPDLAACPPARVVDAGGSHNNALAVDPHAGAGVVRWDCATTTRSWPFRMTHQGIRWSSAGTGALLVFDLGTRSAVPLSPLAVDRGDGWVEHVGDGGAACGTMVYVELGAGAGTLWDEVALDGPVCPTFLDEDGDGSCAEGVDLDGDGACVSSGELPEAPVVPLVQVLEDVENGSTAWYPGVVIPYGTDTPGLTPRGSSGAWLDLGTETWGYLGWFPADETIVTHDTLTFSFVSAGIHDWLAPERGGFSVTTDTSYTQSLLPGPWVPGVWNQLSIDVTEGCGSPYLFVEHYQDGVYEIGGMSVEGLIPQDPLVFDDLGFTGAACPEFVDGDGDGACAEGLDLDLDGECVSLGEPTPGILQDPDEP